MAGADEPVSADESRRLLALESYAVLDTPPEPVFDELVRLTSRLLDVTMAAIGLISRDRPWFKASVGLSASETPRAGTFCQYTLREPGALVVADAQQDARFRENPGVTGEPRVRFYAGIALRNAEGLALGTLCIMDRQPRILDAQAMETLRILARQVMAQLELRRQSRVMARQAEEIRSSKALLGNLSRHVPGVIYQYRLYPDGRSCFPFASENIRLIYEVTPEQVREDASPVLGHLHPDDVQEVVEAIRHSAETLEPWRQQYRVRLPVQGVRWRHGEAQPERLEDGSVLWHGYIYDATEYKQSEERVHQLAYYDTLTGLPNRLVMMERLVAVIARARHAGDFGALLFVDLDNFKQVNDARGHAVGDKLLVEVAGRLRRQVGDADCVARLGGDEFLVQLTSLGAECDEAACRAMLKAEQLRKALGERIVIDGNAYASSVSIGISLYPSADGTADDILREADIAMYRVKRSGRDRVAFFEPHMQHEVEERLMLEQALEETIRLGQLELFAQSQHSLRHGTIGAEVLLRWTHPLYGLVPPAKFIPLAEESGQIHRIGEFVLRGACQALARLQRSGRKVSLSVNVSPRQFRDEGFVAQVFDALERANADSAGLVLEVTEGLLIQDMETTLERMRQIAARGVRFSVDDFGTGYSSLAYLKSLPLHELKIDQSFIAGIGRYDSDETIVRAVISMARLLGLGIVAEGVENVRQVQFMRDEGCDVIQGFLFSTPRPLADWVGQMVAMGTT